MEESERSRAYGYSGHHLKQLAHILGTPLTVHGNNLFEEARDMVQTSTMRHTSSGCATSPDETNAVYSQHALFCGYLRFRNTPASSAL